MKFPFVLLLTLCFLWATPTDAAYVKQCGPNGCRMVWVPDAQPTQVAPSNRQSRPLRTFRSVLTPRRNVWLTSPRGSRFTVELGPGESIVPGSVRESVRAPAAPTATGCGCVAATCPNCNHSFRANCNCGDECRCAENQR